MTRYRIVGDDVNPRRRKNYVIPCDRYDDWREWLSKADANIPPYAMVIDGYLTFVDPMVSDEPPPGGAKKK